jgi:diaminopimelate epimerase
MEIAFTKAHGARNDFLLTWRETLPPALDLTSVARAICDRHTGVGADGWLLVAGPSAGVHGAIQLLNSDGSPSEISGNGTRCAAAFLIEAGKAADEVAIATGAGIKHLRMLDRHGRTFSIEMNMGRPVIEELHANVLGHDCVILNVGNPQCAVLVENFDFDWHGLGAQIESHPRFPNRTNVSFVRVSDPRTPAHTIDVRFFERGAGETMSSGTGSTGAAAAAVARGIAAGPLRMVTPAGPLDLRWQEEEILLTGPAELVATGRFYYDENGSS